MLLFGMSFHIPRQCDKVCLIASKSPSPSTSEYTASDLSSFTSQISSQFFFIWPKRPEAIHLKPKGLPWEQACLNRLLHADMHHSQTSPRHLPESVQMS